MSIPTNPAGVPQEGRWYPIETAPKNGTLIIGALIKDDGKVWRVHEMKHNGLAFYTVAGGSLPRMTHWMPLPVFPAAPPAVRPPNGMIEVEPGLYTTKESTIIFANHERPGADDVNWAAITRLEVIGETGRLYGTRPCSVEPSVQDGGHTLKLFVKSAARHEESDHEQEPLESSLENQNGRAEMEVALGIRPRLPLGDPNYLKSLAHDLSWWADRVKHGNTALSGWEIGLIKILRESQQAVDALRDAQQQRTELEERIAELTEGMALKLAACDVAGLSNTREAFERASIDRNNPAWSPAYESVRRAVLSEMDAREALADAHAELSRLTEARDTRLFPIRGGPAIAWYLMTPHERQAQRNHDQTLRRLAERGGLSPCEAVAVLEDRDWRSMPDAEAKAALQGYIDADLRAKLHAAEADLVFARQALQMLKPYLRHHVICAPSLAGTRGVEADRPTCRCEVTALLPPDPEETV